MGNFSKLSKSGSTKSAEGNSHKPHIQLKDNRPETKVQNQFSELVNSSVSEDSIQRVQNEEEELQMKEMEEEELQMKEMDEEELQMKSKDSNPEAQNPLQIPVQRVENNTGLPDQLKSGVENLSGYSLDDVNVHYNSAKPAQLNAHAYAQGTDIHIGPGQEQHLPHEAWHVVQQKQGRVRPTKQLKGKVNINDDSGLEKEADVMGAKALQMKSDHSGELITSQTGSVVQRDEDTEMTDNRMDDLVTRTLQILNVLKTEGKNWEQIYGEQGGDLAQKGLKKGKDKLIGKSESNGPSIQEKLVKEGLKRWWKNLDLNEKAEILKESGSFSSKIMGGISSLLGGNSSEQESDREQQEENNEDKFLLDLKTRDLKEFYGIYKKYSAVKNMVNELDRNSDDLAKELGNDLGSKVGEIRSEMEFKSKFSNQKVHYKVALLELKFFKNLIKDNNEYQKRYSREVYVLEKTLEPGLNRPSTMILNPDLFSNKERMAESIENCSIHYYNLRLASIVRNSSSSLLTKAINEVVGFGERLIGGESTSEKVSRLQVDLVGGIQEVCNKSWYWFTKGIFTTKPKGVEKVGELLSGTDSDSEKLTAIKKHLIKPEKDLVVTENRLSEVDKGLKSGASRLQKDVTVDKALSKTRTVKDTERYGEQNLDNSSMLAELGAEKVKLEKKKSDLKKEIKGSGRHPLTQVFYNALKNLKPNDVISLGKTISIMNEIASELDNPTHTK